MHAKRLPGPAQYLNSSQWMAEFEAADEKKVREKIEKIALKKGKQFVRRGQQWQTRDLGKQC